MMKKVSFFLLVILTLNSCQKAPEVSEKEDPIQVYQAAHISSLEERITLYEGKLAQGWEAEEKLVKLKKDLVHAELKRSQLSRQESALIADLEQIQTEYDAWTVSVRQQTRKEMVGKILEQVDLVNGQNFYDVEVQKITDLGLLITHRDGRARILFEDLLQSDRERYFYDPERYEELMADEREQSRRRSLRIEHQDRAQEVIERKRLEEEARLARIAAKNQPPAPVKKSSRTASKKPKSTWRERRALREARRRSTASG